MKTYEAKVTLRERNIQEILSEYFSVRPEAVRITVVPVGMLDEEYVVNCEIVKEMEIPEKPGTVPLHWPEGVRDTGKCTEPPFIATCKSEGSNE
ncbi:MAG: hypothetical protein E7576_07065 [Ruminococcaceae bacterium]|nr:hypothetical protein [Oscillospiraceae bacterium]